MPVTTKRRTFIRDPERAEQLVLAAVRKAVDQAGGEAVKLSSQAIFDLIDGRAKRPSPATITRTRDRMIKNGVLVGKQSGENGMYLLSLPGDKPVAPVSAPARRGRRPRVVSTDEAPVMEVTKSIVMANEVEVLREEYAEAVKAQAAATANVESIKSKIAGRVAELQGLLAEISATPALQVAS